MPQVGVGGPAGLHADMGPPEDRVLAPAGHDPLAKAGADAGDQRILFGGQRPGLARPQIPGRGGLHHDAVGQKTRAAAAAGTKIATRDAGQRRGRPDLA